MLRLAQLVTRHVGPLSLNVERGECVCIQGVSGSGKTLLLRAIADLDPHQGEIYLDEQACSAQAAARWRAAVTLLMAESQWWSERIGDHFPVGIEADWLTRLALPPEALDWSVARCSTGERQRLALLRALMGRPTVLLLDEPTGNLDEQSTRLVEELLDDYRQNRPAALLWISHDDRQAARVAERRYRLHAGQLTALSR